MSVDIFVLEDAENKFTHLSEILREYFKGNCNIERATCMVDAEDLLFDRPWDLYVLDVSLDLSSKSQSFSIPSQAVLGGLQIAKTIDLEGLEAPTIIFTAFESFSEGRNGKNTADIVDLAEVDRRASAILAENHIGTVRFDAERWVSKFKTLLDGVSFD